MNTTYDRFVRTTDPMHVEKVQKIFKKLYDQGDIYKGSYKGKYCTPCESFWTESQLVDGKCPDCGRPVVDAEEEAYFFRMSKYADRLMEFPTALLGVALGTVLLPGLSSAYAKGDTSRYNSLLDRGLRLVVLVAVPAAVGLWLTSEALVSFLFQGRSFTPDDVSQTALAVVGYSVGLIGLIALKIVAPAFYARKDIRTPVKTAFWSLVVVQLVNLVSVPLFSHAGLALSVGVGSVFNAGTLLIILMRRGIYTPLPGWAKAVLRIALATLLMGAGLWYGQTFVSWTTMPWLMRAGGVLAMVAVAAVAYFAVMFACGWRLSDLRPGRGDD